ncbi:shikimate kinase [Thermodesulfobacteriota bacterium]
MEYNITLIGMPGAGKSTTGVILAKILSYGFLDTDLLIQQSQKKHLQEIMDETDHVNLRKIEEEEILKIHPEKYVIATGGSAVYSKKAMEHLCSISLMVFLKADLNVIEKRIGNFNHRGIAKAKDQTFKDIFFERCPLYEKYAQIIIDCNSISQEEAAEAIVEKIG